MQHRTLFEIRVGSQSTRVLNNFRFMIQILSTFNMRDTEIILTVLLTLLTE
jgi:hypothetical protein